MCQNDGTSTADREQQGSMETQKQEQSAETFQ